MDIDLDEAALCVGDVNVVFKAAQSQVAVAENEHLKRAGYVTLTVVAQVEGDACTSRIE